MDVSKKAGWGNKKLEKSVILKELEEHFAVNSVKLGMTGNVLERKTASKTCRTI